MPWRTHLIGEVFSCHPIFITLCMCWIPLSFLEFSGIFYWTDASILGLFRHPSPCQCSGLALAIFEACGSVALKDHHPLRMMGAMPGMPQAGIPSVKIWVAWRFGYPSFDFRVAIWVVKKVWYGLMNVIENVILPRLKSLQVPFEESTLT